MAKTTSKKLTKKVVSKKPTTSNTKKKPKKINDKVSALKKELTSTIKINKKPASYKKNKSISSSTKKDAKSSKSPTIKLIKKGTKKQASKKQLTKKPTPKKPLVRKSLKKSSKKSSPKKSVIKSSDLLSFNREVVINNRKFIIPKNHNFHNYLCVWRMYLMTNPKTKKQYVKKFWIVIGEEHKHYRKFKTQEEAIQYFRNLKKFAKMKVQSSRTKEFNRTIYTFFEMIFQGLDIVDVESNTKEIKAKINNKNYDENEEYEDEYTKYDLYINEDTSDTPIDETHIDKIILDQEGKDTVLISQNEINSYLIEQDQTELDESKEKEQPFESIPSHYYETVQREIIKEKTKENDVEPKTESNTYSFETKTYNFSNNENELDDENRTKTYSFETKTYNLNNGKLFVEENEGTYTESNNEKEETILLATQPTETSHIHSSHHESKTTLFDLTTNKDNAFDKIPPTSNLDDEFDIVQYNTDLNDIKLKSNNKKAKKGKNKKAITWTFTILISLILIAALVVVLLEAFNVTNIFNRPKQ